jgi:RimJ/RimL family protein N-acetyltransferase
MCKGQQMIPFSIETERLVLRPLDVNDAGEMVSVLADGSLYEFTGGGPPTLDALTELYRRQTAGSGNPAECWCNWVMRTKLDGRAVGFVQATVVGRVADVAWVVGVNDQGRGLATEAATATGKWLADNGVCRVVAHIHPRHTASQAVARRIGLVRTGEFDGDGEEIWAAGDAADSGD